jgi:hypothetical protein
MEIALAHATKNSGEQRVDPDQLGERPRLKRTATCVVRRISVADPRDVTEPGDRAARGA